MAPDLLLRTIGSRLQDAGQSIYQYKWKEGDPIAWLNPYPDLRVGLNGVTTTPLALKILHPLAKLDYCTIRIIWRVIQEFFLFSTMWFSCIICTRRLVQLVFLSIGLVFFVYDRNWLLHIYNGQMYVVYAFVFAVSGYLISKNKNGKSVMLLFPAISLIRPFFLTAIIPFFAFKRKYLAWLITGIAVAILFLTLFTTTNEWKQYSSAMNLYAKEQTQELTMNATSPALHFPHADPCTISPTATFTVFGAGCLFSLQHYLYLFGISISNVQVFQLILVLLTGILWWIAYKRNWLQSIPKQLILSFLFYQLCELTTPASRNPYNMIQWLPAIAWLIAWGDRRLLLFIIIGLCLNHDIPFRFKYEREIGEMFLFAATGLFLLERNDVVSKKFL